MAFITAIFSSVQYINMFKLELKPLKELNDYLQSLVEKRLWLKVLIALFLGVGVGVLLAPDTGLFKEGLAHSIGNWLALPGQLFLKLVQMIMIPLIFASIIRGITSNNEEQLKKMGGRVILYFIFTTVISIVIGMVVSYAFKPGKYLDGFSTVQVETVDEKTSNAVEKPSFRLGELPEAISGLLPDNPLASMVSGEMLAIVIFAIIVGIAITALTDEMQKPVVTMLSAVQEICMVIVKWAMKMVPYAVFGLMAQVTSRVGLESLTGLGVYTLVVLLGLFILLVFYLIVVSLVGGINPMKFLKQIRDVQLLAFSTTSSAAVMPLSLKTAEEKLKLSPSVSNFIIPVGATINMDGTALFQCVTTIFIAQVYGMDMGLVAIVLVMVTIVAASIGTPSIPGGGVIILASVLQDAGIPVEGLMIIIGIDRLLGMFRTAINVTGDITAAVVFNKWQDKSATAIET